MLDQLTGDPRVPSPQLKTKDNVVHVGHSQPPVLKKDSNSLRTEAYPTCLNNNWSTVLVSFMVT